MESDLDKLIANMDDNEKKRVKDLCKEYGCSCCGKNFIEGYTYRTFERIDDAVNYINNLAERLKKFIKE